jgi:hypothetical protein
MTVLAGDGNDGATLETVRSLRHTRTLRRTEREICATVENLTRFALQDRLSVEDKCRFREAQSLH